MTLESIWDVVRELNRLVERAKPWELAKDESQGSGARRRALRPRRRRSLHRDRAPRVPAGDDARDPAMRSARAPMSPGTACARVASRRRAASSRRRRSSRASSAPRAFDRHARASRRLRRCRPSGPGASTLGRGHARRHRGHGRRLVQSGARPCRTGARRVCRARHPSARCRLGRRAAAGRASRAARARAGGGRGRDGARPLPRLRAAPGASAALRGAPRARG